MSALVRSTFLAICTAATILSSNAATAGRQPVYDDPKNTDADFPFVGEYVGQIGGKEEKLDWGVQVTAMGKGTFRVALHRGGLPGAGWDKSKRVVAEGKREGERLAVTPFDFDGVKLAGTVDGKVLVITDPGGKEVAGLKRIERVSPTMGAKPPNSAIVLFDGTNTDEFQFANMTEDGLLKENAMTKRQFQNFKMHVEFRVPYKPEGRGGGRGNSGIYFQRRYEVQILDTFSFEENTHACGAMYVIAPPKLNMALPPLVWQTYDVEYDAGEYKDGKCVRMPNVTIHHNGVLIHDKTPLNRQSGYARKKAGPDPGPHWFQGHGNPVRFRNVWIVEQ